MRLLQTTTALLLTLSLFGSLSASASEWKGYTEINEVLRARMIRDDGRFSLGTYLGESPEGALRGTLLELLGTYEPTLGSLESEFRNGQSNSVNVLLWILLLQGLSDDLGTICANPSAPGDGILGQLNPEFSSALVKACAWPGPGSRSDATLEAIWFSLAGFDVPFEELGPWKDQFTGSVYESYPPGTVVSAMVQTVLLNPYFLLKN